MFPKCFCLRYQRFLMPMSTSTTENYISNTLSITYSVDIFCVKISLHYLLIYYFNIDNIYQLSYSSSRDSYVCRTGWRNISIRPSPSSSEIIIFCFRSEPPNFQPFGLGLVSWTFLGFFKIVRSPASGKKTSGFQTVRTLKICWTSGPNVMSGRALPHKPLFFCRSHHRLSQLLRNLVVMLMQGLLELLKF